LKHFLLISNDGKPEQRSWDIARGRASSFVFMQRFFWQMRPSFYFFSNNSKTAGHRNMKFSRNIGIYQS